MNVAEALGGLKSDWERLLQFGVWIVALVVLFVVEPPPLSHASGTPGFVQATAFVAAVLIALLLVATRRPLQKPHLLAWITAVVLAVSVGLLFAYLSLRASWTCDYDGRGPIVIGGELLPDAAQYAKRIGRSDCVTLIADSAGRTEDLWARQELLFRQLALAAVFMATVLGFATSAVLAIEALRLAPAMRRAAEP